MAYTLWLKIENESSDSPFDPDEGWLALKNGIVDRKDAVALGNEISTMAERNGLADPGDPLDGWWGEE